MFCSWHLLKRTCGNKMCVNPSHHYKRERDLRHPSIGKRKQRAYVIHPPGDTQIWTVSPPVSEEDEPEGNRHVISGTELLEEIQGVRRGISDLATSVTRLLSSQSVRLQGVENVGNKVEEVLRQTAAYSEACNGILSIEKHLESILASRVHIEQMSESLEELRIQQHQQAAEVAEIKQLLLNMPDRAQPPSEEPKKPKMVKDPFMKTLAGMFTEAFSCKLEADAEWQAFEEAFTLLSAMDEDTLEAFIKAVERYAEIIAERGDLPSVEGFLGMLQGSVTAGIAV